MAPGPRLGPRLPDSRDSDVPLLLPGSDFQRLTPLIRAERKLMTTASDWLNAVWWWLNWCCWFGGAAGSMLHQQLLCCGSPLLVVFLFSAAYPGLFAYPKWALLGSETRWATFRQHHENGSARPARPGPPSGCSSTDAWLVPSPKLGPNWDESPSDCRSAVERRMEPSNAAHNVYC